LNITCSSSSSSSSNSNNNSSSNNNNSSPRVEAGAFARSYNIGIPITIIYHSKYTAVVKASSAVAVKALACLRRMRVRDGVRNARRVLRSGCMWRGRRKRPPVRRKIGHRAASPPAGERPPVRFVCRGGIYVAAAVYYRDAAAQTIGETTNRSRRDRGYLPIHRQCWSASLITRSHTQ